MPYGKYLTHWDSCLSCVKFKIIPIMKLILTLSAPILSIAAMLLSSCASSTSVGTSNGGDGSAYLADYKTNLGQPGAISQPEVMDSDMGYWDGDGVSGSPLIKVNIAKQTAYFYKGSQLVGQTPISTGKEGKITPKGTYKVTQKSKDHKSSLYGVIKDNATGAIVNAKADSRKDRAKAGQTFENVPMPNFLRFNGPIGMHAGHLPGYPASAGCVRMPEKMSEHFFNSANLGTPVIVE
jgi:hypothetical protein